MTHFPQRVGNYRLERQIGKGGMSEVWLARHRSLEDRLVAVKLLLSQDTEWIARFAREANITSRLQHEYIVQIYDHGHQPPYYYTIMEHIVGGALRELLKARKPLPLDMTLHVFRCAGYALDYAHAHGVIHRDVSPGNILIEQSTNRVLLTDFGIARESGKVGVTTINKIMGTPGYLSPEHASSATAVTHLSDIYSLGVVLFEMLSGTLPWNHLPGMVDGNGGPFDPPLPLRSRGVEGLPSDVDRILQTMLALDPAKRYPTAQAAIDELDRVLARHTSPTQVVAANGNDKAKGRTGDPAASTPAAPPVAVLAPVEPPAVERVLGPDLLKGPLQEAARHASVLAQPQEIAALLDRWSDEGYFRRKLLGRQAAIHRIATTNCYFYTIQVLLETREPAKMVEEPDRKAAPVQLEKEADRWDIQLPPPKGFEDESGGSVRLPGSLRVVACTPCAGVGRTTCPRCHGQQRIAVPRDGGGGGAQGPGRVAGATAAAAPARAATTLAPCPECSGTGGLRCARCEGVGRLLQKKTVQWRRRVSSHMTNDDLPRVDEQWLQRNCKASEVYRERFQGGFRPEWRLIPALSDMIAEIEAELDGNTRATLSEVTISFIPVTEIVFDLGSPPQPPAAKGKAPPKVAPDAGLYRWHIYGFERRLPKDWRFLNWDRVFLTATTGGLTLLAVLLAILLM